MCRVTICITCFIWMYYTRGLASRIGHVDKKAAFGSCIHKSKDKMVIAGASGVL